MNKHKADRSNRRQQREQRRNFFLSGLCYLCFLLFNSGLPLSAWFKTGVGIKADRSNRRQQREQRRNFFLSGLCYLCFLLFNSGLSAAIDPYVKHVLTTNAVTLGTNLTFTAGVLEAIGGGTSTNSGGGDTIWTNTPAGSVQLLAPTNYLALGVSADAWFGTTINNLLVGVHDVTAGDPSPAIFNISAIDDATSLTNYADLYFRGDSSTGNAVFNLSSYAGAAGTDFVVSQQPTDIIVGLYADGTSYTLLNPTATSSGSAVAYLFDSKNSLTNGDATVTIANAGTPYIYAGPGGSPALSVTSLAEDNSTNVALVVDTAQDWDDGVLLDGRIHGTNVFAIRYDGGWFSGRSALGNFPEKYYWILEQDLSKGEKNEVIFQQEVVDDINSYAYYSSINTTTLAAPDNSIATTTWQAANTNFTVTTALINNNSGPSLTMNIGGPYLLHLQPSTTSGTAYLFDTSNVLTSGDAVVTFKNATIEHLKVAPSSTAKDTSLLLLDVDTGTLKRVSVGANDSGGAGFKLLRIAN